MNRVLVLGAAAAVAFLALHRPTSSAAVAVQSPVPIRALVRRSPAPAIVVYVAGAVRRPGLYTLRAGARANDALRLAGGFSAGADATAVNLAELIEDGEELRVPKIGDGIPAPRVRARTAKHRSTRRRKRSAAHSAPIHTVNLNASGAQALAALPGIGDVLAERIVEYRRVNGPFASLDELADVAGLTQRRIDAIAPYVTIR